MSVFRIGCIVEGHGEVASLPVLIPRLVRAVNPNIIPVVPRPVRVKRDRFVSDDREFERNVLLASASAWHRNPILIVLDSEGGCPAEMGPRLLGKARSICPGRPVGCVIAHQEYETWFLASVQGIRDHFELSGTPTPPPNPESRRGAKEWIEGQLWRGEKYRETIDQKELTRRIDIDKTRSIPSFDKLYREVARLVDEFEGA